MTDPLDTVEQRLSEHGCEPRRRGDSITARCPAHGDRSPSLSVSRGDRRDVVVNCFAGCEPDAIMSALGLAWTDLSERRNGNGSQIVATYPYHDEGGTLLYEVVRLAPKSFRQRRPVGDGWEWNLRGVERTLYRLPEVLAAVAAGEPVFITEGEKDADRLVAEGVCATTCSGGAGRFTLDMAAHLEGADVTIVADRDDPGREHAAEVAFLVAGAGAASVRVVEAVTGKDAADHLAAGHGVEDFAPVELAAKEPPPLPGALGRSLVDWPEFWATDHSASTWLMEPLFAEGRGHAVYAEAKAGKSWVLLAACCALASGREFLGHRTEPTPVLYLDYEMTPSDLQDRLEEFGYGPGDDLSRLHYALLPEIDDLDDPKGSGGDEVYDMAVELGARLVVIDTTSQAVGGEENEANTYRNLYRHTLKRLKGAGIATVRLDHTGKDVTKGMRGSSAKAADVDIVVHLKKADGGKEWHATHRRIGWYPERTAINVHEDEATGQVTFSGATEVWPAGTAECAAHLDALGLPLDISHREARAALVAADLSPRAGNVVTKAVRWRQVSRNDDELEGMVG